MLRIFFLLFTVCLTACVSPMRLGISEAEWRNYSPEEQKKIKSGYYAILKKETKEEKILADGTILQVRIFGGEAKMPPFDGYYTYTPVEFAIKSGDCQTVTIKSDNGEKSVPMKACYHNKTLYLDPSRYDLAKSVGSIQLHYSPIWNRGFTFQNVSSSGYVNFNKVNVAVRIIDNNEPDLVED